MKIITYEDIKKLNISALDCFNWTEYMIKNKSNTILPAKISMHTSETIFCNIMPSIINYNKNEVIGGVKIVTRYPNRVPALDSKIQLFDALTGEMLAYIDANWITAMRTGCVATNAIKTFARKNFSSIGIVGLGNTARATLSVLAELYKNELFTIYLFKYKNQAELFAERFNKFNNFKFIIVNTYEELMEKSDVVISAVTYFPEDICDSKFFKNGITLIPIHTRGFGNCDLFFDKIFADDKNHVCHFKYFDKYKYFAEVSDVVNGKRLGRTTDEEKIIVYNIGISIHDVNFAYMIYKSCDLNKLKNINFKEPKEKFWL